ncbi:MAG TPA: septal ring lytic transglycosylase RlpA family protein [Terriglobales bacterium]|nr:septal ring lytic transglycosylase RlpA family protein [Terriglobales bacterium]
MPPAPPISQPPSETDNNSTPSNSRAENEKTKEPKPSSKPLFVETGLASWYGPPYHNRRSSNGEIYNMNALTAAHLTLPLESVVRVTNLKTGHSVVVRITDRGPFVRGRILDLSKAAAKKADVWLAGVAMVRMEVLSTPAPLNRGGRWSVQIGAFEKEHAADKLADHLSRRYETAKILTFSSPIGDWWVRVRVHNDDRSQAEEIARDTRTAEGSVFLVRLD